MREDSYVDRVPVGILTVRSVSRIPEYLRNLTKHIKVG